jgi:hypothetical protein
MTQLAIPIDVAPHEIARKGSLGAAIELCAEIGGKSPKEVQADCRFDKGQWSRWTTGTEGIVWPRLVSLMDHCGNDVPVLWQVHQRGYDLHSLHRIESELERRNRMLQRENDALRSLLMGPRG